MNSSTQSHTEKQSSQKLRSIIPKTLVHHATTVAKVLQGITERPNATLSHLKNVHSLSDTNKRRMLETGSSRDLRRVGEAAESSEAAKGFERKMFASKGSVQQLLGTGRKSLKFRRPNHSIAGKLQSLSSLKRNSHSNLGLQRVGSLERKEGKKNFLAQSQAVGTNLKLLQRIASYGQNSFRQNTSETGGSKSISIKRMKRVNSKVMKTTVQLLSDLHDC